MLRLNTPSLIIQTESRGGSPPNCLSTSAHISCSGPTCLSSPHLGLSSCAPEDERRSAVCPCAVPGGDCGRWRSLSHRQRVSGVLAQYGRAGAERIRTRWLSGQLFAWRVLPGRGGVDVHLRIGHPWFYQQSGTKGIRRIGHRLLTSTATPGGNSHNRDIGQSRQKPRTCDYCER